MMHSNVVPPYSGKGATYSLLAIDREGTMISIKKFGLGGLAANRNRY